MAKDINKLKGVLASKPSESRYAKSAVSGELRQVPSFAKEYKSATDKYYKQFSSRPRAKTDEFGGIIMGQSGNPHKKAVANFGKRGPLVARYDERKQSTREGADKKLERMFKKAKKRDLLDK